MADRERLRSFDSRPLFGKRVLVTRAREQSGTLAALLEERGAIPVELATIQIEPPTDWTPVDRAIDDLAHYAWAIFTSANGVRWFFDRLEQRGSDVRALEGVRIAAIGPSTTAAIKALHLQADFTPSEYVGESFVAGMQRFDLKGQRVLLPRAQDAREVLVDGLRDQGAIVDDVAVYQTRPAGDPDYIQRLFRERQIDVVTLTSSSTARNLVTLLGNEAQSLLASVRIASIGPITSQTAASLGLTVHVEAAEHTVPGLVTALEEAFQQI